MKTFTITAAVMLFSAAPAFAQAGKPATGNPDSIPAIELPAIQTPLKQGAGSEKASTLCNICHSLDYITTQPALSRAQWTATVDKMVKAMGAPINEEDAKTIINYLVENYGTSN